MFGKMHFRILHQRTLNKFKLNLILDAVPGQSHFIHSTAHVGSNFELRKAQETNHAKKIHWRVFRPNKGRLGYGKKQMMIR